MAENTLPRLTFSLPLDPARLLRARHRIRDYLYEFGAEPADVDLVVLAMEEAMTNAVRHSGSSEELDVSLCFEGADLVAEVTDHGNGFDVSCFDPSVVPDLFATGGRGLFLIASCMDDLQLRCNGGLKVRAVKRDVLPISDHYTRHLASMTPGDQAHRDLRQRVMLDELPDLYAGLDWEFRYVYVNERFCLVTGRTREELLSKTLWEVFPEIVGTDVEQRLREAMNLGMPSHYEFYFSPRESWFEQRLYPTSFGISQFSVEITERKKKEQEREKLLDEVRESREGLERTQEMAHLGSWELDLVAGRLAWSDEVYRIFGLQAQEFGATYEAFLEHVHPDDRQAVDAAYSGSLAENRDGYEIEHRVLRTATGEIRYVLERCRHVRDAAGKIVRSLGMVHDITELRSREANLAALKEIADAASSSLHLDVVATSVVESVHRLLDAQQVQIRLVNESGSDLEDVASIGFSPELLGRLEQLSVDADMETALCFRTKAPRISEHVQAHQVTKASRRNVREAGIGSYVLLPLMEGGEAVGTFYVAWAEPRHFSPPELSFLEAICGQFVGGLVHSRLFDAQQQAQRQAAAELERTKLLQDVTTAATGSLSLDEIGYRVLALTMEALGAFGGAIYTVDEAKGQLRALALAGYPEEQERQIRLLPLNDQFTIGSLVAHDLPLVTHESEAGPASTGFAGRLQEEDVRWFALPIKKGEAVLGVFGLQFPGLRRFEETELSLYRSIAVLLGEALQNARLYEAQRDIATTLQQSFRHPFPRPAGFDVGLVEAPAWEAALIGGDFWDLFELPDKRVVAIIGDVAGKGVKAAALTETVRSTMRAFAHIDAQPSFILRKTNEVILARGDDLMVTSLVMVIDAGRSRLSVASAGHPGPVRLTSASCAIIDPVYGPPLGAFETEYSATKLTVGHEDCLVLYTDGVTEARRHGELFGERRLLDTLRDCPRYSAQELADAVLGASQAFAGRLQDDLQVMVLRLV